MKSYLSPALYFPGLLSEGAKREWLAEMLLQPDSDPHLNRCLYAFLFETERDAIIKNCLLPPGTIQAYRTDLFPFTQAVFKAIAQKIPTMTLQADGYPFAAAVYPRPLQMALVCLCRSFLHDPFSVEFTVTHRHFQVKITAATPPIWNEDLRTASLVVLAHGGRLMTGGNALFFQFSPDIQTTAVPRWITPETDGLLRDPLSFVNIGCYSASQADADTQ